MERYETATAGEEPVAAARRRSGGTRRARLSATVVTTVVTTMVTTMAAAIAVGATPALAMAAQAPRAGTRVAAVGDRATASRIVAVGAENQYANVISQIGGPYVRVSSVENNPNTDPHSFEASPQVAELVSSARLVVQNGLGYDSYMTKIEQASPNRARRVIDVQSLLGLPGSTRNPHLWYKPTTMPVVAKAIATDLAQLDPAHARYFRQSLGVFDRSLEPWYRAIARLKATFPHADVATTEPVADYMLYAAGLDVKTPWTLQADIMNGVDPAPQAVTIEDDLLAHRVVKVFVYNEQVTDAVTSSFLQIAERAHVPVVGVYETMPTPGYDYQSWMMAETAAVEKALAHGTSTRRL